MTPPVVAARMTALLGAARRGVGAWIAAGAATESMSTDCSVALALPARDRHLTRSAQAGTGYATRRFVELRAFRPPGYRAADMWCPYRHFGHAPTPVWKGIMGRAFGDTRVVGRRTRAVDLGGGQPGMQFGPCRPRATAVSAALAPRALHTLANAVQAEARVASREREVTQPPATTNPGLGGSPGSAIG